MAAFFGKYPPAVGELAASLREAVRAAIPDAVETLDEADRVVGYGVGEGYDGLVCTIIPSKTGVKLGVVRGAQLPDPNGLLEGAGKLHKYVQIAEPSDLKHPGIAALLKAGKKAAHAKLAKS